MTERFAVHIDYLVAASGFLKRFPDATENDRNDLENLFKYFIAYGNVEALEKLKREEG